MKKLVQVRQRQHSMQLTWVLNNICTNHCDYCPPTLHMGTNHHYEWDITKGFVERLLKRYQKIHCSITGGEPTVSPFFPELVKMFYDAGHSVGITSNAARNVRYWDEISPMLSYICFSYHPSQEDPLFLEKALAATKHTHVSVRVMMDSRHWDKSFEFYNKCVELNKFTVENVKILPEMADRHIGDDYTDEQLAWLAEGYRNDVHQPQLTTTNTYRPAVIGSSFYYDDGSIDYYGDSNYVISSGQNDFRGWSCNIGLESLFIHFDGYVKKGNCLQGGNLFHINDHEKHDFPNSAEICLQKICHCGTDVQISKAKLFDIDSEYVNINFAEHKFKDQNEYSDAYSSFFNKKQKKKVIKIIPEDI